jgi:hypothetical protein
MFVCKNRKTNRLSVELCAALGLRLAAAILA